MSATSTWSAPWGARATTTPAGSVTNDSPAKSSSILRPHAVHQRDEVAVLQGRHPHLALVQPVRPLAGGAGLRHDHEVGALQGELRGPRRRLRPRDSSFTCRVLVAPGHYPDDGEAPDGDFSRCRRRASATAPRPHRSRSTARSATVSIADRSSRSSRSTPPQGAAADFHGPRDRRQRSPDLDRAAEHRPVRVRRQGRRRRPTQAGAARDRRGPAAPPSCTATRTCSPASRRRSPAAARSTRQPATPTGDGESSPAFADLDGDNRNELIFAGSDGFVHALRPDGTELAGLAGARRPPAVRRSHIGRAGLRERRGRRPTSAARCSPRSRSATPTATASPRSTPPTSRARSTAGTPTAAGSSRRSRTRRSRASRWRRSSNVRKRRDQPHPARLHRLAGARRPRRRRPATEIVAAAMDRHVYAWNRRRLGRRCDAASRSLVVDPAEGRARDRPATHRSTFDGRRRLRAAGRDRRHAGGRRPRRRRRRRRRRRAARDRRRHQRGVPAAEDGGFNAADRERRVVQPARPGAGRDRRRPRPVRRALRRLDVPLDPGNTRLYALNATATRRPAAGDSPRPPAGRPSSGSRLTGLLPVVGEGVTGSPVIGPVTCRRAAAPGPQVGALANNGPAYILNADGDSCYGRDGAGHGHPARRPTSTPTPGYDHPVLPAVGHPAFGDLGRARRRRS